MTTEVAALSDRERQVVTLVSFGLSNTQIGTGLGISPLTVKSLLARGATKLGTGERAGMVGAAFRCAVLS